MGTADNAALAAPGTQMSAETKTRIFATDENQMDADKSRQNSLLFICVRRSSSVANSAFLRILGDL
jgi:hypothetical protein